MFLLLARFHARPVSYKALILAFTTWIFELKGWNTHQRGELSTSGWRPWSIWFGTCNMRRLNWTHGWLDKMISVTFVIWKNSLIEQKTRAYRKYYDRNLSLYLCTMLSFLQATVPSRVHDRATVVTICIALRVTFYVMTSLWVKTLFLLSTILDTCWLSKVSSCLVLPSTIFPPKIVTKVKLLAHWNNSLKVTNIW